MKRYTSLLLFAFLLFGLTARMPAPTFATGDFRLAKKAASGPDTPIALTPVADRVWGFDASANLSLFTITTYGKSLIDDADASTALSTLGFSAFGKTIIDDTTAGAVLTTLGVSAFAQTILDDADAATLRATIGLIGTDTRVTFFDGANTPAGDAGMTYNKTTDTLTLVGDVIVATEAYSDAGWNGDLSVPTKDAVRDKLVTMGVPRSYLTGYALSNNVSDPTNDIDVAVGTTRDTTDAQDIALTSSTTKQLDAAWAAGSAAGGLDQGSIANATYHIHAIRDVTNNLTDVIFSLSHDESAVVTMTIASPCVVTWGVANRGHGLVAGSPIKFSTTGALPTGVTAGTQYYVQSAGLTETTFRISTTNGGSDVNTTGSQSGVHTGLAGPKMPSGYTVFRRIGSIVRASAAILPFIQDGDTFQLVTPVLDVNTTTLSTSRTTFTASSMPAGLRMQVFGTTFESNATAGMVWISDLLQADLAPSTSAAPLSSIGANGSINYIGEKTVRVNTLAQFGARAIGASTTFRFATHGWIDRRGRDR